MHPSVNYIKFVLARHWDEEAQVSALSMTEELESYGLLPINDKTFDRIRSAFNPPTGFKFMNRKHAESIMFMKAERLYPMWTAEPDVKRVVTELLGQRLITDKLHILLMGDVPSAVIASKLTKKFRINPDITPKMIDAYRHFYWNPEAWGYAQWNDCLVGRTFGDWLMASLHAGSQQALYRAGFNPKYDPKIALRDGHRQVTYRIQHLGFWEDSATTVKLLCQLLREERALYDRLYGEGSGLLEQAKEVRRFLMEHRLPGIVPVEKFIEEHGGSYSNDGKDSNKADETEEDENETDEETDNETEEETNDDGNGST